MKSKGFIIKIAFGREVVNTLYEGRALTQNEKRINLKRYKFNSENEAKSFIEGVNEGVGWSEYYILNPEDS
jgi:hypothetical protein